MPAFAPIIKLILLVKNARTLQELYRMMPECSEDNIRGLPALHPQLVSLIKVEILHTLQELYRMMPERSKDYLYQGHACFHTHHTDSIH